MNTPFTLTEDGFESQMGTNHIGHFYLTILLFDSQLINQEAKIINVSGQVHRSGQNINVENLFKKEKEYKSWTVYGETKLANILFTIELQRRLDNINNGTETCSLHPGIVITDVMRNAKAGIVVKVLFTILSPIVKFFLKSPIQGAQTTLSCVLGPIEKGAYYSDCKVIKALLPPNHEELAKKLWNTSEEIINYKCKSLPK